MKKAVFFLITLFAWLFIAALAGELALRIYGLFDANRGLKNSMGSVNKKYSHSFKPNTRFRLVSSKKGEYDVGVRINNFGFRGKDISLDAKPGVVRIMAIGDSFVFGVGSEDVETIPFLMEEYLRAEGADVEVINAGFGHYSPALHYIRLRDEYINFKPDLVVLFFDFSDLADDWRAERSFIYDSAGKVIGCDPLMIDGKKDWWAVCRLHSKLCSYLHNKLIRTAEKIRILGIKNYVRAKLEGKRAKSLIVNKDSQGTDADMIKRDGYLMMRGRDKLPVIREHFKRTEKYLDLIKDFLGERGIPVILVLYPYGIHVGPYQWGVGRRYWGFESGRIYDDYYAFDILEDYAARKKVPCINLLTAFLAEKNEQLFFDIDGHFTPIANKAAADALINNPVFQKELGSVLQKKNAFLYKIAEE